MKINIDKVIQYEFTHEVARWAKTQVYKGIKFEGTRGRGNDYINFVIFDESVVSTSLNNFKKIVW